jgi:hypothetical protein
MKVCLPRWFVVVFVLLHFFGRPAAAQSTTWDSLLTNSLWYVPAENLLAYMATSSNFANPQAVADQTLWNIGTSVNGVFSGTSIAEFKAGPLTFSSTTTMNGLVTDAGQVRIIFTQPDTPATIGIGQVREIGSHTFLEMQMITGEEDLYITHWAYMASYDGNPENLPNLEISPSQLRSEEWSWMAGTSWSLQNDDLFGTGQTGSFFLTSYHNGYYWGTGTGPEGSATETFSVLGSATPEGNILFNVLSGTTLTSLTGVISGTGATGHMLLRSYSTEGTFGNPGLAQVVPEPATAMLVLGGAGVLIGLQRLRRRD